MARVVVSAEQFVTSDWPPVCAMTGRPTSERLEVEATSPAPGMGFMLIFGVFAMLVASGISERDRAIGSVVPLSRAAYGPVLRAWRARNLSFVGGVGGGILLGGVTPLLRPAGMTAWMLTAFALVVGGAVGVLAASVAGWRAMPHLRLSGDRQHVWISNVHPGFVAALEAADTT